jgi:hypothetical protein
LNGAARAASCRIKRNSAQSVAYPDNGAGKLKHTEKGESVVWMDNTLSGLKAGCKSHLSVVIRARKIATRPNFADQE